MLRSPPRYSDPNLPPLDDADRKLVSMLLADGRASGRDLAQQTGISEANVSRRLARLVEERSIWIVGFVAPELLGLEVQFSTWIRVKGCVDEAAKDLLKHPEFAFVTALFGRWDLIAYGVVPSTEALDALLDRSIRGNPKLHRTNTELVLGFHGKSPTAGATARELDRTDRLIIREVQKDGRISFTDIAQNVGISATSAADRFRRLTTDGVVRILTLADPPRVDLGVCGLWGAAIRRPAAEVMADLAILRELSFLCTFSGEFPVHGEFQARDGVHLDELRERMLSVPGVDDVELNVQRRLYRQDFAWGAIPEA